MKRIILVLAALPFASPALLHATDPRPMPALPMLEFVGQATAAEPPTAEQSAPARQTNQNDANRAGASAVSDEARENWSRWIAMQEGRLPIILSAPHGGQSELPEVPPRTGKGLAKGPKGFVTSRDFGTQELTLALVATLEARMGAKPYYVAARFHRRFVDANRPAAIAYEHAGAKPAYDAYHHTLDRYCREVRARFGRGLLLDIHGQSTAKDTVFRGTQNGRTVALLVKRFGEKAQNGPESFFGLLAARGFKVVTEENGRERAGFTGGYIVSHYGGQGATGIDALQLEFGGDYRARDKIEVTAGKLADAILAFATLYLPEKPVGNAPHRD